MQKLTLILMAAAMLSLGGISAEAAGSTATPWSEGFAPCVRGAAKICGKSSCICIDTSDPLDLKKTKK